MSTKVRNQLKTFGIIVVLIGVVFAGLGLNAKHKEDDLRIRGVSDPGKIIAAAVESGAKGKKRYILTVTWGQAAAQQTQKFAVTRPYYERKVEGQNHVVTPDTTIRHIPGEAGTAVIEGSHYAFAGVQWVGYVIAVIGLIMAYKGFRGPTAPPTAETAGV